MFLINKNIKTYIKIYKNFLLINKNNVNMKLFLK